MIIVDFRHRFTVIHLNEMNVFTVIHLNEMNVFTVIHLNEMNEFDQYEQACQSCL